VIVDYAWSHPGGAALQAAGVQGAARYLGHDSSKDITRAEADDNAAHGVWSACVFEDSAQRPLAGHAAGVADAQLAYAQAVAAGMPDSRPIYFAVDTDTDWASVEPYAAGWASVLGPARSGVYGGLRVIQGGSASGLVSWYWQTDAWSGGVWDVHAHLRQEGSITINGVDCDRNTAMTADYGQWMPGISPAAPIPNPSPRHHRPRAYRAIGV
jgi:hypothetical protein